MLAKRAVESLNASLTIVARRFARPIAADGGVSRSEGCALTRVNAFISRH
jgi:hypothetical protein